MDIIIRLAGIQLGPYSEEQVRQHVSEGLLSLNDVAQYEGRDEWMPLSDLLAKPQATAETKRIDVPRGTPPPADSPAVKVPPSGTPSETPTKSGLDKVPEEAKRAPSTPPGVTQLPQRPPESPPAPLPTETKSFAKKSTMLGPSAPIARSRSGPTAFSSATTSPLASAQQGTKRVAGVALGKALAQTSPLPTKTKSIAHPRLMPRPLEAHSTGPAAPPKLQIKSSKATPSAVVKDLEVKTVPMRSMPAVLQPQSTLPITKPLLKMPVVNKPALDKPVVHRPALKPPAVLIKVARPKPEPLAPPVQKSEPAPPAAKTPESSSPPDKKPEPPSLTPQEQVSGSPPDFEIKTIKIPPPSFPPKNISPETTSTDAPAKAADKSNAPASRRKLLPILIGIWALLALIIPFYIGLPYHSASSLRKALDAGDPAGLAAVIDFSAVRASLKEQIKNQLEANVEANSKQGPSAAALTSVVLPMLDHSIDTYVTPEGISALVNKSDSIAKEDQSQLIAPDVAAKILLAFNTQPESSEGLASLVDFVLDRDVVKLHLRFQGMGWKLNQVALRPDLGLPGTSGSAPALLSPVVDTYLERGEAKANNSDWNGAIADFTQALTIDPQSSVAYHERGAALQSKGDLDGAIKDYSQALAINPQMAPAYERRGNARLAKSDLEGAIADFTQAIATDPNLAGAFYDRGQARQANSNLDGAIADYTQALALQPKMAGAYYNRGLARQAQGNLDGAIVDFDRALTFDPTNADGYYNRGNAKSANHDLDGAIADYTQALTLNPKNAAAYANRGVARQTKGDIDGALADFTQALAIDPKNGSAFYNRSVIEAQKNDVDDAIADSTQALYIDPKNAQAYCTRGFAKLTKGNLEGALDDLTQFCDLAPRDHNADHARLYLWLIAKAQNSTADADGALSTALESSWNSASDDMVSKTAAFLLGRLGEADYLAAAASSDAKTDQSQHCQAWYFAGMKRLLAGDKKGAIDAFHQCLASGQKDSSEYVLAQTELQILEAPAPATPSVAPPAKPSPAATVSPSAKTPPAKTP